jgi:hypothetical protein
MGGAAYPDTWDGPTSPLSPPERGVEDEEAATRIVECILKALGAGTTKT